MKKRLVKVSGAIAVAAGLVLSSAVVGAGSAHADDPCFADSICIFEHENYVGRMTGRTGPGAALSNVGLRYNDIASSAINNTNGTVCFYEHDGYRSELFRMPPRSGRPSLPGGLNDKVSSWNFC